MNELTRTGRNSLFVGFRCVGFIETDCVCRVRNLRADTARPLTQGKIKKAELTLGRHDGPGIQRVLT